MTASTGRTSGQNCQHHDSTTAWFQQRYDISAVADNQATVWIRWGYRSTDSSWTYSGWNIDDVEIWALSACTAPTITGQPSNQTVCSGGSASFTVTATGYACADVPVAQGHDESDQRREHLRRDDRHADDQPGRHRRRRHELQLRRHQHLRLGNEQQCLAHGESAAGGADLGRLDRNNFCADDAGNISLSATGGSGTTLRWLTGSCTGTSIGTGNPLVIASPTATTTYYARWENTCGNSTCASVTVTVLPLPVAPTSAAVGPQQLLRR